MVLKKLSKKAFLALVAGAIFCSISPLYSSTLDPDLAAQLVQQVEQPQKSCKNCCPSIWKCFAKIASFFTKEHQN